MLIAMLIYQKINILNRRNEMKTKTVLGITLKKTFGKNHYNWVANFNGYMVKFVPYLGRYNNKVNGWSAHQVLCSHLEPEERIYSSGPTLISVVKEVIQEAQKRKDKAIDDYNATNGHISLAEYRGNDYGEDSI
jgi:hypothetical protein